MELYELTAYFFIYGFLGWCVEVAFAAVKSGRFVNRGFLGGPICPVYGIGVASVLFCLSGKEMGLPVLYLTSAVLVTLVEWVTGYVLDKIFHNKWWDYTGQPLNIGGYVCLPFSLIWGVFCVFIVRGFHPWVELLVSLIPFAPGVVILAACGIALLADLYVTAAAILKLNRRMAAMERVAAELRELSDRMGENIYENVRDGQEKGERLRYRLEEIKETGKEKSGQLRLRVEEVKETGKEKGGQLRLRVEEVKETGRELGGEQLASGEEWYRNQQLKLDELKKRYEMLLRESGRIGSRLLKAFPNMQSRQYREVLRDLKQRFGLWTK